MAITETVLGRPLYTFIYLTTDFAGAFASFVFSRAPSLGASGAVLGIFGAQWMYFQKNKPYLSRGARQVQANIQQVTLLNLSIGFFIAKVDNWCALPGFVMLLVCRSKGCGCLWATDCSIGVCTFCYVLGCKTCMVCPPRSLPLITTVSIADRENQNFWVQFSALNCAKALVYDLNM